MFVSNSPCPTPVCDCSYLNASYAEKCVNGECVRPDVCACEVGW